MYSDKSVERECDNGRTRASEPLAFSAQPRGVHGCFALSPQDWTLDRLMLTIYVWGGRRMLCARAPILLAVWCGPPDSDVTSA